MSLRALCNACEEVFAYSNRGAAPRYCPACAPAAKKAVKAASQKARRAERKAAGICTVHSGRPAVAGKTVCQECLDYHRSYYNGLPADTVAAARQQTVCDVSGLPLRQDGSKGIDAHTIDHDHETGQFRGVLANGLNQAEGLIRAVATAAGRSPADLARALAAYMDQSDQEAVS